MKYLSLDIETTGLNPQTDHVLQVAGIVEDTKTKLPREACPSFVFYNWRESYSGHPFALAMNVGIFQRLLHLREINSQLVVPEASLIDEITNFTSQHFANKILIAGKNVSGFDLPFLKALPNGEKLKTHYRVVDPSMLFIDFATDELPPDLKTCKERSGLSGHVAHDALDDAWDVISVLRKHY
jgi:oligoribonuclease